MGFFSSFSMVHLFIFISDLGFSSSTFGNLKIYFLLDIFCINYKIKCIMNLNISKPILILLFLRSLLFFIIIFLYYFLSFLFPVDRSYLWMLEIYLFFFLEYFCIHFIILLSHLHLWSFIFSLLFSYAKEKKFGRHNNNKSANRKIRLVQRKYLYPSEVFRSISLLKNNNCLFFKHSFLVPGLSLHIWTGFLYFVHHGFCFWI